jgi:hypothetical protein
MLTDAVILAVLALIIGANLGAPIPGLNKLVFAALIGAVNAMFIIYAVDKYDTTHPAIAFPAFAITGAGILFLGTLAGGLLTGRIPRR